MNNRRNFLKQALNSATVMALPLGSMGALAQSMGDYRALVCVYLYGGNDSENTIIPLTGTPTNHYGTMRVGGFDLRANANPIGTAYHSAYQETVAWGLHPSLTGIANLYNQDKVAVMMNVGTLVQPLTLTEFRNAAPRPINLFSHSDQQIQSQTASPDVQVFTGWGGRIVDQLQSFNLNANFPAGVSLGGNPIMLAGESYEAATLSPGYNLALSGNYSTTVQNARNVAMRALLERDTGKPLLNRANYKIVDAIEMGRAVDYARSMSSPVMTSFPGTFLGAQLREVAQLINMSSYLGVGRHVFFVALGGFDTHQAQLYQHAPLLTELNDAIVAFQSELETQGNAQRVTTFTMSDFGRTLRTNGSGGTDHAWGGHHFVIGGAVNGGFYGRPAVLLSDGPDSTDVRGRWIPTTGYDQYGATLAKWLGVSDSNLPAVFPNLPNFSNWNLGFV